MRRFWLKRRRYDSKVGCESCIDLGAGPGVPPMAEIPSDIDHALSRLDQHRNRHQPLLLSTGSSSYSYCFSGKRAAKFSKKMTIACEILRKPSSRYRTP